MVAKKDKVCPKCGKRLKINVGIKNRLKKFGETDVKCIGCGNWFSLIDGPEEKKIDKRTREYREYKELIQTAQ